MGEGGRGREKGGGREDASTVFVLTEISGKGTGDR